MSMTGHPHDVPLPDSWRGRAALITALDEMVNDFDRRSDTWENPQLLRFLEALAALLGSIENAYANSGTPIPEDPWVVMADAIEGARFYE